MVSKICKVSLVFVFMWTFAQFVYADNNFQCLLTVTKAKDWSNETLKVQVLDAINKKVLETLILSAPKKASNSHAAVPGVNQMIKVFDCINHPNIQLMASYTPIIWSASKGKTYLSKYIYHLYPQIMKAKKENIIKLEIMVTFPNDFVDVPLMVQ